MEDAVQEFSQRSEHTTADSTFVVIMSHGELGKILGVNYDKSDPKPDQVFPVDNIFTHLNTAHCKDLRNKPKVIIIQACRGGWCRLVSTPTPLSLFTRFHPKQHMNIACRKHSRKSRI